MKEKTRTVLLLHLAVFLFGETREVGLSFWLGITLVIISVILQTYRIRK